MALKLKKPPASEPLTLTETKSYLKVTDTADDTVISQIITPSAKVVKTGPDARW